VATQDPVRQRAVVVEDKAQRVAHFHANTLHALGELLGAAGLMSPSQVTTEHLMVRDEEGRAMPLADQVDTLAPGVLLQDLALVPSLPPVFQRYWPLAQGSAWAPAR
jgi:hypothetical protein